MDNLVVRAEAFATKAHEGQTEKDGAKTPYIHHVKKVAELVATSGGTPTEIAAAWLHDVVEDTNISLETIEKEFGADVAHIVSALTDLPEYANLPTAERKQKQADHIAKTSSSARRVKLADQISAIELDSKNELIDKETRRDYVRGCRKIADSCKGITPPLDEKFDLAYKEAIRRLV